MQPSASTILRNERKIRVGVIYSAPAPYQRGLFERLARRPDLDLKVYFLGRFCGVWNYEMENAGNYPHEYLELPGWMREQRYSLWLHFQIPRILKEGRFDAVVVAGYFIPSFLLAIAWCRVNNIPYLLWSESHEGMQRSNLSEALRPFLLSPLLKGAAAHLAVGIRAKDYLQKSGIAEDLIFHMNHSADVDGIAALVSRLRPGKEQWKSDRRMGAGPVALFVGRIAAEKGIDDLLEAYAMVVRSGGEAPTLVLVGRGDLLESVRSRAQQEGWLRVYIEGFVPPEKVWEYYAYADFVALPSRHEPYGVVVQEAMAAGLPVVTTDAVGAAADFVRDGKTGYVIPVGDTKGLMERMMRFWSNPSSIGEMRAECEKAAGRYDQNYGERQFVKAIRRVIGVLGEGEYE